MSEKEKSKKREKLFLWDPIKQGENAYALAVGDEKAKETMEKKFLFRMEMHETGNFYDRRIERVGEEKAPDAPFKKNGMSSLMEKHKKLFKYDSEGKKPRTVKPFQLHKGRDKTINVKKTFAVEGGEFLDKTVEGKSKSSLSKYVDNESRSVLRIKDVLKENTPLKKAFGSFVKVGRIVPVPPLKFDVEVKEKNKCTASSIILSGSLVRKSFIEESKTESEEGIKATLRAGLLDRENTEKTLKNMINALEVFGKGNRGGVKEGFKSAFVESKKDTTPSIYIISYIKKSEMKNKEDSVPNPEERIYKVGRSIGSFPYRWKSYANGNAKTWGNSEPTNALLARFATALCHEYRFFVYSAPESALVKGKAFEEVSVLGKKKVAHLRLAELIEAEMEAALRQIDGKRLIGNL